MSIRQFVLNRKRVSLSFVVAIALGLLLIAVLIFPSTSRAKLEPTQEIKVSKKARRPSFRPGEIIVRYKNESMAVHRTGMQRLSARDGRLLSMKVENFEGSQLIPGLRVARLSEGDTLSAVAALRGQPDVLYAEPNYILRATVNPNDTHFVAGRQISMNTIGAPTAWNTNTGNRNVVVGVIDQGIDINHQDLQANIWTNPMPGSIPGFTGDLHGYNFVNNNGTVFSGTDGETHASHVAGIIGAVGNNNRGVAGVNWAVSMMSLKFLDEEGSGDTVDAIRACTYAKDMRNLWETSGHTHGANVRVINASFGGAGFTQSFLDAINQLNTAGILFVAAAGNTDQDGAREPNNDLVPLYPSSFNAPNLVAVAAVNQADALATDFSHFGATSVDLAAPGDTILSTTPHCANPGPPPKLCQPAFSDANGDTYTFFKGTSMSTPHVSGAAALLWAQDPNLTPAQVKSLLLLNGDVRPTLVDKTLTGRRLNIANSFQSLAEIDNTAPGPVTNFHINSQNGRTINLGWTASGDDGANGQASLYQLNFTDGGSGAVIPLKGLVPLPSGAGQIAEVTIPYRHTSGTLSLLEFDNVGNSGTPVTVPVGIPLSAGDPYTSAIGPPAALSTGGRDLHADADDLYIEVLLPTGFIFPFFGQNYTEVTISTNGALYFGDPPPERVNHAADDMPSSASKLGGYRAIAGLWDDLDLRTSSRADAGVFEVVGTNKVIYRFQGVPCNTDFITEQCLGGENVNFEIELNSNGVITTRYGSGNTQLFPIVGIAGGGQDAYIIASHTNEETPISLTNASEVTFTPRSSTITLSQSAFNANENLGSIMLTVNRSGDTSIVSTIDYATSDAAGAASCNTVGTTASSRCDYLTTIGTLKFAAGETSKTVAIPIVNDIFTENPEQFSFSLSNPKGAILGATTTATVTISDGAAEGGNNPIDDDTFFVRQHYVDFLNREPDALGLAFWLDQITSCGNDLSCIEVRRINVSASFFLSIEFQETGFLVYRTYKAGLGNLTNVPNVANPPVPVKFTDFLRYTQQMAAGIQVGVGDWKNQLEANKRVFLLDFVQTPEFLAAFPNSFSATNIVNKMNVNIGNLLSDVERTELINILGATPADPSKRALVLRRVAENETLTAAELRKAFVLMQYFGYLRRNPYDPPEATLNFAGFDFWLNKLNAFDGNYIDAEMVKAFMTSIEYRTRFAP